MTSGSPTPARIIISLKAVMKSRQITYRDLARRIRLSEASIKRIFSRGTLTLTRLDEICQALEVSLSEVVRLASEASLANRFPAGRATRIKTSRMTRHQNAACQDKDV